MAPRRVSNTELGDTQMTDGGNTTNELLAALATASEERKVAALKALRGEVEAERRPMTGPLLLGMGAAAEYLGVSRPTLWRMIQARRLEKVELFKGSHRIRRADLERICERPKKASGQLAGGSGQPTVDPRFQQLKALADEGDENAVADLFKEYSYDYHNPGRSRS